MVRVRVRVKVRLRLRLRGRGRVSARLPQPIGRGDHLRVEVDLAHLPHPRLRQTGRQSGRQRVSRMDGTKQAPPRPPRPPRPWARGMKPGWHICIYIYIYTQDGTHNGPPHESPCTPPLPSHATEAHACRAPVGCLPTHPESKPKPTPTPTPTLPYPYPYP